MFSSYSSAIMLRPISPRPPRGMARNLGVLAKERELLLRLADRDSRRGQRSAPLIHALEVGLDGLEVLLQRSHQKTVIPGGGRRVGRDIGHPDFDGDLAVQARDRRVA